MIAMTAVRVGLDLVRHDPSAMARCPRCQAPLALHQPDAELPGRLLGACEACKAWALIDVEAGLMLLLPDAGDLRDS
jgi:hypothetical protein